MIQELGDPNYIKKSSVKTVKIYNAKRIHEEAVSAGMKAMNLARPTPMVVGQHTDVLNDNSPVVKSWFVEGGCCGFAWIEFKANTPQNRKFLAGLKSCGLLSERGEWSKNTGKSGYSYWVGQGGQSMERKEAFAYAYAGILNDNGITAHVLSRMD